MASFMRPPCSSVYNPLAPRVPLQVLFLPIAFDAHGTCYYAVVAKVGVALQRLAAADRVHQISMMQIDRFGSGLLMNNLFRFRGKKILRSNREPSRSELQRSLVAADQVIDRGRVGHR